MFNMFNGPLNCGDRYKSNIKDVYRIVRSKLPHHHTNFQGTYIQPKKLNIKPPLLMYLMYTHLART